MTTPQSIAADIAKELKEHPERWTRGAYARDSWGLITEVKGSKAVCWCLLGHVMKRTSDIALEDRIIDKLMQRVQQRVGEDNSVTVSAWNDRAERTVAEVIELCEEEAQS